MLICALANGTANEASIPVNEKSRGPSTLIIRQFRFAFTRAGIALLSQTIDSSSLVRVTEKKDEAVPHVGMSVFDGMLQTAYISGRIERLRLVAFINDFVRNRKTAFCTTS